MPERDIYRCGGCGWKDGKIVEAGGLWYCPNQFCSASGGWNARRKADYHDEDGNQTNEQLGRMYDDLLDVIKIETDPMKLAAYARCKTRLEERAVLGASTETNDEAKT